MRGQLAACALLILTVGCRKKAAPIPDLPPPVEAPLVAPPILAPPVLPNDPSDASSVSVKVTDGGLSMSGTIDFSKATMVQGPVSTIVSPSDDGGSFDVTLGENLTFQSRVPFDMSPDSVTYDCKDPVSKTLGKPKPTGFMGDTWTWETANKPNLVGKHTVTVDCKSSKPKKKKKVTFSVTVRKS